MSPEQAAAEEDIDGRTDIYALGVMLFQMLTGHLPYSGPNAMSILLQHRQSPIPSPLALRPDLPAAIEPVLRRVLAKIAWSAIRRRQSSAWPLLMHWAAQR